MLCKLKNWRMRIPKSVTSCFGMGSILFLLALPAQAGMAHRDCRTPLVFDGAAVNVVVLPYRYANGNNSSPSNLGNRLSLLVKLDVLSHILDYGSIGAVQMEMPEGVSKDDPSCQPEVVLPKLLGQQYGAEKQLAAGHGLVLVWGLLYEEDNDVYAQTYAQFLRRDTDDVVSFRAGEFPFSGKLSADTVAFTPQKFTQEQLRQVEDSYRNADLIHKEPKDDSPGERLPELVAKCAGCDDSPVHAGFYVLEKKGEWIRIRWMDQTREENREGWIHSSGGLNGKPLDQILPELKFIEGCAGYLRLRVADAEHNPLTAMSSNTVARLKDFVESNAEAADMASALALQMAGVVDYMTGQDRVENLTVAANDFEQARKLVPSNADAITLAVAGQISQEWRQKGKCDQSALKAQRLAAAGALGADKTLALGNLRNLYRLLLQSPPATTTQDDLAKGEVQKRLAAVETWIAAK